LSSREWVDPNARDTFPPRTATGTLILALGNPLRGDDGIGVAVLEALAGEKRLPHDLILQDGGAMGLEMLLTMQSYRRVIIVDAGNIDRAPGEWARLRPDDLIPKTPDVKRRATTHDDGLAEALMLGATLGILPPEIIIYAVQPLEMGWLPGLSQPMQKAIPAVCAAILETVYNIDNTVA